MPLKCGVCSAVMVNSWRHMSPKMSPRSQNVSKNVSEIYTRTTNLGIFPELNIHLLNATGGTKPSSKLFANLEL